MLFTVDLDELVATVDVLGRCGEDLDALLDEVSARVAGLHRTWGGRAAAAQVVAQAEWATGYREMCAGLATMRAAAGAAHGRYDCAAITNVRMWGQVG